MSRATRFNSSLRTADAASTFQATALPAAVGPRSGAFDALTGVYLPTTAQQTLRRSKQALATARAGLAQVNLLCAGDSETAGLGVNAGGTYIPANAFPGRLATYLNALGYAKVGTGWVYPAHNLTAPQEARITTTGSAWTTTGPQLYATSTGSSTITFTSDVAGTIAEFQYLPTSAAFSYQIDGGSAVNVTPAGSGTTPVVVSVTGLSSSAHTVTINASAAGVLVQAFQVRAATGGLLVSNAGIAGSTALNWLQTAGTPSGVGNVVSPAPDITLLALGINDARSGGSAFDGTPAQFKANYGPVISRFLVSLNKPVWLCVQVPPAVADQTGGHYSWAAWQSAIYDLADIWGCPLLDLTYHFGGYQGQTASNTDGLYYDGLHPSDKGYALVAHAWATALTR